MALLCRPELLIADEPTTALDVTIQAQVLELIKKLQREMGTSLLLITHDLGVVAETCDRVAIMYAGEIVEHGTVEEVFRDTRHPYTQGLFDSIPKMTGPCHRLTPIEGLPPDPRGPAPGLLLPPAVRILHGPVQDREAGGPRRGAYREMPPGLEGGDDMSALLEVRALSRYFKVATGVLHAVDDVSFRIEAGKTLGIVGESGCGKSTLGRTMLRLQEPTAGRIFFDGMDITAFSREEMRQMRRYMQIIFQDPYASLDPRLTIAQSIEEPLKVFFPKMSERERRERIESLMELVGLSRRDLNAYPHEFDGGRRQRVVIARPWRPSRASWSATSRSAPWTSASRPRSST